MRFGARVSVSVSALFCTGLAVAGPSTAAHQEDAAAGSPAADAGGSGFVLATTTPGGPGMAPAFVGNGYLAGRQPFDGQGFAAGAGCPASPTRCPRSRRCTGSTRSESRRPLPARRRSRRSSDGPRCRPGRPCPTTTAAAPTRCRAARSSGYRQAPRPAHRHADHVADLDLAGGSHGRPPVRRHARSGPPARGGRAAADGAAVQRTGHGDRRPRRPGGRAARPDRAPATRGTQWVDVATPGPRRTGDRGVHAGAVARSTRVGLRRTP